MENVHLQSRTASGGAERPDAVREEWSVAMSAWGLAMRWRGPGTAACTVRHHAHDPGVASGCWGRADLCAHCRRRRPLPTSIVVKGPLCIWRSLAPGRKHWSLTRLCDTGSRMRCAHRRLLCCGKASRYGFSPCLGVLSYSDNTISRKAPQVQQLKAGEPKIVAVPRCVRVFDPHAARDPVS